MTTWFGDDDEDDEEQGGVKTGDYEPPKDLPIPGETDPLPNDKQ